MQNPYNFLDGVWGRINNGPMHRFTFDHRNGNGGIATERMLRKYGIRVWGRELWKKDERAFLVKKSQAAWAEYLMLRAGVQITSPLVNPKGAKAANGHGPGTMPRRWTKNGVGATSIIDHIVDTMHFVIKGS